MPRAFALHHRLCQASLLPEPEVASSSEIVDGMLAEKFPREPFRGGFVGDRLRPVLAKLGDLSIAIRTRPGAALAIESGFLIRVEQRFESTHDPHLANGEARRLIHRRDTGSEVRRFADFGRTVR